MQRIKQIIEKREEMVNGRQSAVDSGQSLLKEQSAGGDIS